MMRACNPPPAPRPTFSITETPDGILISKTAATKRDLCAYPDMDIILYDALECWSHLYANGTAITREGSIITLPPSSAQTLILRIKAYATWEKSLQDIRAALIREGWKSPEAIRSLRQHHARCLRRMHLLLIASTLFFLALLYLLRHPIL